MDTLRDHQTGGGLRLRERRLSLGLSQAALGHHIGMQQVQVSQAELHPREFPRAVERLDELLVRLGSDPRRDAWLEEERQRIARQEAVFAAVPPSLALDMLVTAMLERCLELMHQGRGEACDAIAEWLPEPAVRAMFDRWEAECLADRKCSACEPSAICF